MSTAWGGRLTLRLPARSGRSRAGEGAHDGLARANIAQEHAAHRMRLCHLAEDVESGLLLLVGKRERNRRIERLHARARDLVCRGHMATAASRPLLHEVELKQEHFLVRQAAPRLMGFGKAFGKVNRAECDLTTHQSILHAKLQRHRVENAFGELERVAHEAPHQRRRHLLASRVHGNDEAVRRRVGPFERKDLRVHHSLKAVVELDFTGNRHAHAGGKLLGEPRLAKCGHNHDARRVSDANLHQGQARFRALELNVVDHALDGARLADARRSSGLASGKVDVAPREMRDEPADRANAELLERLRARGAHEAHAAHRLVKPERGLQPIGYVGSFRQNFLSQWKQTSFHFNVENAASGGASSRAVPHDANSPVGCSPKQDCLSTTMLRRTLSD